MEQSDHVPEGHRLRADIHTLFDLSLLKISPDGQIHVDSRIATASDYQVLHGKNISMRANTARAPDPLALERKFAGAI